MKNTVALIVALCSGVIAAGSTTSARQAAAAPLTSLVLPAGFHAEVFAENVGNARMMALGSVPF